MSALAISLSPRPACGERLRERGSERSELLWTRSVALTRSACREIASSAFSPKGDLLSFACAKESKQRKAHPGPVVPLCGTTLRCSDFGGAAELAHDEAVRSDSPRAQLPKVLCFSAPSTGPNSTSQATSKATSTAGACFARAASAFDSPGPLGGAEKRSARRGVRHGCRTRAAGTRMCRQTGPEHASIAGQCEAPPDQGVFFLVTSFAQAKEVTRRQAKKALEASAKPAQRISANERNRYLDSRLRRNNIQHTGALIP